MEVYRLPLVECRLFHVGCRLLFEVYGLLIGCCRRIISSTHCEDSRLSTSVVFAKLALPPTNPDESPSRRAENDELKAFPQKTSLVLMSRSSLGCVRELGLYMFYHTGIGSSPKALAELTANFLLCYSGKHTGQSI